MERFNIPWSGEGTPFVFPDKPAGHRCAWSCKWATSAGIVRPDDWFTVDEMSNSELRAELEDLIARGDESAQEFLPHLKSGNVQGVPAHYIARARDTYPEYLLPYGLPHVPILHLIERPGWPLPEGAKQTLTFLKYGA